VFRFRVNVGVDGRERVEVHYNLAPIYYFFWVNKIRGQNLYPSYLTLRGKFRINLPYLSLHTNTPSFTKSVGVWSVALAFTTL
jgi:hypothetical protein